MKTFTTVIALACLAIGITNAQISQPALFGHSQATQWMPCNVSLPVLFPILNRNYKNTGERSAIQPRSFFPLYDSVYNWELNDTTLQWQYASKEVNFGYNANDSLTNFTTQIWKGNAWENEVQYAWTYNDTQIIEVQQNWNGSAWVNKAQWTYGYNSNNQMVSYLLQKWSGSAWENSELFNYTYNSGNDMTNEVEQTWTSGAWVNNGQYVLTYNSDNSETSALTQSWSSGAWVDDSKDTFTYNASDLELTELDTYLSGSTWVNDNLFTITYNSNNLESGYVQQDWSGGWVNDVQYFYTYNSNNDKTGALEQIWSNNNTWVNNTLFTYNFDANNIEQSAVTIDYQGTGDTIEGGDSTYAYYHTVVNSIDNISSNNSTIHLYPNPSSDFIHANIQLKQTSDLQLHLINMLGQTIWSTDAGNVSAYQNNISVANLSDGVYLLEMITGSGTQSREVVVTK